MLLCINTPEGKMFEGKIEKVVLPTEVGEICVLKNHQPLISIIDPGIVKIKLYKNQSEEFIKGTKFLFEDDRLCISVGSGVVYISGKEILVLTNIATSQIETDQEVLEKMKKDMEKQIEEIKIKGSLDDLEKAFLHIKKISADIKLYKIKKRK